MSKSLKQFIQILKKSHNIAWHGKSSFLPLFIILVILGHVEFINKLLGIQTGENASVWPTIICAAINLIITAQIILWQKKSNSKDEDGLLYSVPAFLLYSLYYSFLFIAGGALLILPGLYVLVYFFLAPIMAVLDDTNEGNYFKRSKALVQKNVGLVAIISILTLLLELLGYVTEGAGLLTPVAVMVDGYLTIVLTIASVEIYYLLSES